MPIVSMFYGIVVKLNTKEDNPQQVHAYYAGQEASCDFNGKRHGLKSIVMNCC